MTDTPFAGIPEHTVGIAGVLIPVLLARLAGEEEDDRTSTRWANATLASSAPLVVNLFPNVLSPENEVLHRGLRSAASTEIANSLSVGASSYLSRSAGATQARASCSRAVGSPTMLVRTKLMTKIDAAS